LCFEIIQTIRLRSSLKLKYKLWKVHALNVTRGKWWRRSRWKFYRIWIRWFLVSKYIEIYIPKLGDKKLVKFVLLMLGCLFITLYPVAGLSDTPPTTPATGEVELPYRLLVNSSKTEIILIGSAHLALSGITSLATRTRESISTASMVLFEVLPNAAPVRVKNPLARDYLDEKTLSRLKQLSSGDPVLDFAWNIMLNVPADPDFAAGLFFFWRCLDPADSKQVMQRIGGPRMKSADRMLMDSLPPSMNAIGLETVEELNSIRVEQTAPEYAERVKSAVILSFESEFCFHYNYLGTLMPKFIKEHRIRELYDENQKFDCMAYACSGFMNGYAFSEVRNRSLASKILRHSQGHRRVAVIVGALHLDERAGLMKELRDVGFHEIENNLVGEPRR
jgi:hypothetical protein